MGNLSELSIWRLIPPSTRSTSCEFDFLFVLLLKCSTFYNDSLKISSKTPTVSVIFVCLCSFFIRYAISYDRTTPLTHRQDGSNVMVGMGDGTIRIHKKLEGKGLEMGPPFTLPAHSSGSVNGIMTSFDTR